MEESPKKPKKRKSAPKPKALPEALEAEIQRIAAEILEGRSNESRRTAALEVANKLLKRVADLLAIATSGIEAAPGSTVVLARAAKPAVVLNPCVLCGRAGKWQDRSGKGGRPWYCVDHAGPAFISNKEESTGGGLLQALKSASPIDDSSLPE